MTDRIALGDFLRRRRERLQPADVGLPGGSRRRTRGLRREEVAVLAGVSSDFYARLEQARGSHPSEPVVIALARALRCDPDQRDHLFRLAGFPVPARRPHHRVDPVLLQLTEHLDSLPVLICNDLGDVLWSNSLDDLLLGRDERRPGRGGNVHWNWFTDAPSRQHIPQEQQARLSEAHVSDLRATYSRRPADPAVGQLVDELAAQSEEFGRLWERHDVAVRSADIKEIRHPSVGLVQLRCQVLHPPQSDLRIRVLLPLDGTNAAEKLRLLQVIGAQKFPTD
ncbi:helix-turn-helix transcriptional regulator [Actinacidiphila reveromycinica]|nr:helix-turn-helix transcriptional regulator [Streptomyces sp. SN-593]